MDRFVRNRNQGGDEHKKWGSVSGWRRNGEKGVERGLLKHRTGEGRGCSQGGGRGKRDGGLKGKDITGGGGGKKNRRTEKGDTCENVSPEKER